jgi:hypothetical protein
MALWIMRRMQWLRREEFTLFRAAIAAATKAWETPTNDGRDNVLRTRKHAYALNYGGAIV